VGFPDAQQTLAVLVGKWPQQNAVHDGEYSGRCTHAQRESQRGDSGEAGRLAQHPSGEAKIQEQRVEEGKAAGIAMLFSGLLLPAEAEKGLAVSFGRGEAALEIFFDGQFEVSGYFGVQVAIQLISAEEGTQAAEQLSKAIGHLLVLPSGFDEIFMSNTTITRNAGQS